MVFCSQNILDAINVLYPYPLYTIFRCNTYFCYLCGARLSRENPYGHYSERSSKCFNQLFEGANDPFIEADLHEIEGDDSDDDFLVVEDANGLLRLL